MVRNEYTGREVRISIICSTEIAPRRSYIAHNKRDAMTK